MIPSIETKILTRGIAPGVSEKFFLSIVSKTIVSLIESYLIFNVKTLQFLITY